MINTQPIQNEGSVTMHTYRYLLSETWGILKYNCRSVQLRQFHQTQLQKDVLGQHGQSMFEFEQKVFFNQQFSPVV